MKRTQRWIVSIVILFFIVIIGTVWIITTDNVSWQSLCSIIIAVLGVLGTFTQWLFPPTTNDASSSSQDAKQQHDQAIIFPNSYQRQKLEEQKTQASNQKSREKQKKRNRLIISISSATVSVVSIIVFIILQLSPQIHFITNDSDYRNRVTSLAWSPNGMFIALTTQDGSVRIWNVAKRVTSLLYPGGDQTMYNFSTKAFNNISWSPSGRYVAFGNNDDKIRMLTQLL